MKYRLDAPHAIGPGWYPAGTEVGDGTGVPYKDIPSTKMSPLDPAAEKAVEAAKRWREAKGQGGDVQGAHKAALDAAGVKPPAPEPVKPKLPVREPEPVNPNPTPSKGPTGDMAFDQTKATGTPLPATKK